jgi:putative IMPACT (imprinted ancient) family translation regulator
MYPHVRLRITVDYGRLGAVQQEIRHLGLRPPDEEYGAQATLTVAVPLEQAELFRARLSDLSAGQAEVTALDTVYLPR